ncbi:Beta-1 [Hyphodiscus hymeniophilus]|uniref:Beta-1 n=1 Tax=Hyphodiscus hymeniophilus TaxID=353542 RepID=A0A9P7AXB8_9HELO|nr:Beta-1 [Hyphodiscus hymeniophilus]
MSFQSTAPSHHLKFFGLAMILVCAWFLYTIPDTSRYHPTLERWSKSPNSSMELLPLDEAEEYCLARRWEPYPHRQRPRKIYDLMLINTELEWLEIRMGQLEDQVDFFVILEAPKTFTDEPKPLYVRENWPRFSKYHHKMILHTLDTSGADYEYAWAVERFSRNAMYDQVIPYLMGSQEAFVGDVILVSDVDEIPRPDALKTLRNCDFPKEVTLHTKMFYYGFQWLKRDDWPHPQATFYNNEDTVLPDDLRGSDGAQLYNAGWHCSYCFPTLEEMISKIKSFSHTELDREEFTDRDKIVQRVRAGKDMFDREDEHFDRIEDNPDVPQFLVKNKKKYSYLLNRDPPNAGFEDY